MTARPAAAAHRSEDPLRQVAEAISSLAKRVRQLEIMGVQRTWVELDDITLDADAAYVEFADIVQTYAHIRIIGALRSDRADTGESVGIRFNGDVGNNYTSNRMRAMHPVNIVTSERFGDSFMSLTGVTGGLAPAGFFGVVDYFIPHYTVAGLAKSIACLSHHVKSIGAGGSEIEVSGGTWLGGAITSVRLYPAAGGTVWKTGSRLTLFGIG